MARKEALAGQRFACDRPGCNKHYSRPDHLLRHKLNHDREKVLACDQCERTFVRQDLLARHLERHALRGKTLGRWSGKRKRDGQSEGSSQGHHMRAGMEDDEEDEEDGPMYSDMSHSIASTSGIMQHSPSDRYANNFQYGTLPPPPPPPPAAHYPDPRTLQSSSHNRFEQPMSVPMREDLATLSAVSMQFPVTDQIAPFERATTTYTIPSYGTWSRSFEQEAISPSRPFEALPVDFSLASSNGPALLESSVPGSSHFTFSNPPQSGDFIADYDWLFDGTNPLLSSTGMEAAQSESSGQPVTDGVSPTLATDEDDATHFEEAEVSTAESGALHDLAFFAILQRDIPEEPAFDVDVSVHARLLHFLSSLQELPTSPLFTPAALRCYLHLFFAKLNTMYPLIHRPTFSAKTADPMLLSAMIVCGAHFADEAAHFLAERIARKLWGAYISFEDFRPARATLAMLQAMLLTELFGKTMGTRPQHETAHLFHNFIITLARRNAVFTPSKVSLPSAPEEKWRSWAREEEKKRIALFSFLLDAQHAIVFRHIPALSSFQIHLQLPCEEALWEAKSSQEWQMEKGKVKEPPTFIAALKASLSSSQLPSCSPKDPFQQFILLHGLMSVAYDLQWKQQTLLAAPETSESISNWKNTLKASYVACQKRLEEGQKEGASDTAKSVAKVSQSLTLWAQIVLHADAVDIQIYAGLPTVLGRFIDHHTFSVARKSCREWARSEDARLAVHLAAGFLKATLLQDDEVERHMNSGYDELLLAQWIQYLCALVIWAYSQALVPSKSQQRGGEETRRSQSRDEDTSTPQPTTLLQVNSIHAHSALAKKIPNTCLPSERSNNEARLYVDQVLSSDPLDEESFNPPHQYITGVLELVEKMCRGSRWELGREVSGVLRKLIRERNASTNQFSTSPAPSIVRKVER